MDSRSSLCSERRNECSQQHRARSGFSLIELLVALVLLEVGLLALVGMAAASTRDANISRRESAALSIAVARLERTASLPCQGTNSGVSPAGSGVIEWYTETVLPNDTRVITDSVIIMTTRGSRTTVLRMGARC
ncbi:MAG TPA: prepilin-type N-terminal cleavage/methylation domain-containing protein [Gemmatimonadaceae bacterium]|nr:prepilin-type N-terminal cleavage/methylation domain-containing protein [Gemmatimonadaceae bacterium]